jgi:hypothetical protein
MFGQHNVIIGGELAGKGSEVRIKSNGQEGTIQDIGRCGLVALRIPGNPILGSRAYAPGELELVQIRKEAG